MTIAAIIAEFGAYYLNNGQNATRLVQLLFRRGVTEQLFSSLVTDDTIYQAAKTVLGTILQPFQKGWTPKGSLTVTPITIKQFKMKADVEETPDDLEATWLGFLADASLKRTEWPFVRWFMEVHLIPQVEEDYELNEIYGGVRVEPTNGTAGAPGTAMDGIRKILNDHTSAGRITPMVLGAIPTDPVAFCEYVEAFVYGTNKRYRSAFMNLAMNEDFALRYAIGRAKKYSLHTQAIEAPITPDLSGTTLTAIPIQHAKQQVVGLPSMGNSEKIWMTPPANAKRLAKKSQNMTQFQIENVDRKVKLYTDFWKGVGFLLPEAVFTNDKDLV
ncbi:hypothetical protein [uncultured Hymenobacter sp.]|uniref:hypothetical protein n=1 Tax=uncultured Hymenobacter sp. TaxID=170016 RepID=UPI0035CAE103